MNRNRLAIVLTFGLLGLVPALLWLAAGQPVIAQPIEGPALPLHPESAAVWTVCLDGPPACDFDTVQEAVDAANDGDLVKVATGVYTGVQARPVPPGYLNPPFSGLVTQVVYLSETLTIRGGYTTDFTEPPDPIANPTTLDAEGQGRVFLVAGTISPTIEGLHITGGDATGLGGYSGINWLDHDTGGGLHVINATATISDNVVFGNTAGGYGSGGGLYLLNDDSSLRNNTVTTNTADSLYGGGLYTLYSNATLTGNTFSGNTAGWGGAVFLEFSPATLVGNDFSGNTCASAGGALNVHTSDAIITGNTVSGNGATYGGAMRLYDSAATLTGNIISGNESASYGGGLHLWISPATLSGNTISDNTAGGSGGGLELWTSNATITGNTIISNTAAGYGGGFDLAESHATLVNNIVADNQATIEGDGLYVGYSAPHLMHNTLAYNGGTDGSGIYVINSSSAVLTNTLLVGHATGIYVATGSAATLEATLWGNGTDWDGDGTIVTGTINLWGNPAFTCTGPGCATPYRIGPGSAARDRGVNTGVTEDIDGEPRPGGLGYDIGADEFHGPDLAITKQGAPDPVQAGARLTYTLRVTNTGTVSLTATITDILPENVTPTGTLTWTSPPILPGDAWIETVVTTVEVGYAGLLTNVMEVTTEEGAAGAYTHTVTAEEPIAGLEATNDSPTSLGSPTTLTATVTTGSNVTYTWAFGDDTTGNGAVVAHIYPALGVYEAVVTAGNSVSILTATTTVTITELNFYVYLPLVVRNP